MGNERFAVVTCVLYSLSSKQGVDAMGDRMQACYLSLDRWSEPPYLAATYLVSPW